MSRVFQRSFQGRSDARDRERTRQSHREKSLNRYTRMGPAGSVEETPAMAAQKLARDRFDFETRQHRDAHSLAKDQLAQNQAGKQLYGELGMRGHDVAEQLGMRGHDVAAQGNQFQRDVGMRGHDISAQGNQFQRDVGMRGHDISEQGNRFNREAGFANIDAQRGLGQMQSDTAMNTAIVGQLPALTTPQVDPLGRETPPPSSLDIQRTVSGIKGAFSGNQQQAPRASYNISPDEARVTATNAFHSLGKKGPEIGKRVLELFDNPGNMSENLDKIIQDPKLSVKEREAIINLAEMGYFYENRGELGSLFSDVLGKNLR